MHYEDCMIYLWNDDKTRSDPKSILSYKGNPKAITANLFDVMPAPGVRRYVMQAEHPSLIEDTRKDNRYRVDDIMRLSEVLRTNHSEW